jgi:hypothetical protein
LLSHKLGARNKIRVNERKIPSGSFDVVFRRLSSSNCEPLLDFPIEMPVTELMIGIRPRPPHGIYLREVSICESYQGIQPKLGFEVAQPPNKKLLLRVWGWLPLADLANEDVAEHNTRASHLAKNAKELPVAGGAFPWQCNSNEIRLSGEPQRKSTYMPSPW